MYSLGIAQPLNPYGTKILQFYWIYKDAIDLTSTCRWKVRFRHTFFKMKYKDLIWVLYKLVLITYPLDHSQRIYSPSNFRFMQKTNIIKYVPILFKQHLYYVPKINLEHLELLRPWGPHNCLDKLKKSGKSKSLMRNRQPQTGTYSCCWMWCTPMPLVLSQAMCLLISSSNGWKEPIANK